MSLFGLVLSPLWVSLVLIGIGAITVVVCLPDARLYYAGSIDGPQLIGLVVGVAMIIAGVGVFGHSEYAERTAFPYEAVQRSQVFALRDVDIVKNVTTTTDVDLVHYGIGTTGTITQYETAYTGGAIILHDEAGTRYTIAEVRQSATVTEPEFRLTWIEETLPDNVEPDAQHPRVREAYSHQVVLVLPMPDADKVISESQGGSRAFIVAA